MTTLAEPLALAAGLLEDVRTGRSSRTVRADLASLDPAALALALPDDASKIVFWTNLYNAVVRARLLADPAAYGHRRRFFAKPTIVIAGQRLSLGAIEHGILRRSAFRRGLGHIRNPFPSAFERRMRVSSVDPRIHFALNCGARSCPPFAAWDVATLDQELERATAAYLTAESQRIGDGSEVMIPRLLLWYRGDFGGGQGIATLLRRHGVIGPDERPRLRFGAYDWTLDLDAS